MDGNLVKLKYEVSCAVMPPFGQIRRTDLVVHNCYDKRETSCKEHQRVNRNTGTQQKGMGRERRDGWRGGMEGRGERDGGRGWKGEGE